MPLSTVVDKVDAVTLHQGISNSVAIASCERANEEHGQMRYCNRGNAVVESGGDVQGRIEPL